MSAGTKVTIAVVVLFATLLGVYYTFVGPDRSPGTDELPPAELDRAAMGPIDDSMPATPASEFADQAPGVLTASVEQAIGQEQAAPEQGFGVLASDGGLPATTARPKPPDDPWVIGPRPAFPEAAAAPEPGYVDYAVREGDSMWTIADRWLGEGSRWSLIADANPAIDPDRLRVGQRIRVPSDTAAVGPMLNAPARVPEPGRKSATLYTVRSGDTLSRIAQSQYRDATMWRAIYDANRTAIGGDPDRLEVGMRLRIPPA
ncbi:MAG: LysM peptidoglycan-binding domain-containing protein [Planctomycetota bacterium]|jgi:nucleoid-associated protein YgaU